MKLIWIMKLPILAVRHRRGESLSLLRDKSVSLVMRLVHKNYCILAKSYLNEL